MSWIDDFSKLLGPGAPLAPFLPVISKVGLAAADTITDEIGMGEVFGPVIDFFEKVNEALSDTLDLDKAVDYVFSGEGAKDFAGALNDLLQWMLDDNVFREQMTAAGGAILYPIFTLFEGFADDPDRDPRDFARAFIGFIFTLASLPAGLKVLQGTALQFLVGPVGKALDGMYWHLGLGFLSWQALSPLFNAGLGPRLERYYNNKFRPKRFPLATVLDLYRLDEMTLGEVQQYIKEEGWRDMDILKVIRHSETQLSRGDITRLQEAGFITSGEMVEAFEALGYGHDNAYLLTQLETKPPEDEPRSLPMSRMRSAFINGTISEQDFVNYMRDLNYGDSAIRIEVANVKDTAELERKELNMSQIKQAYSAGVVTQIEVQTYLAGEGYAAVDIGRILATWDANKKPKILKVNKATILRALQKGIIGQGEAIARLMELGYSNADVTLIMQEAMVTTATKGTTLSISQLMRALSIGAISQAEFNTRMLLKGVVKDDLSLFSKLALYEELPTLSISDIERAYKTDILDMQAAIEKQVQIGETVPNAQLRVTTWQEESRRFIPSLTPGVLALYYKQGLLSPQELQQKLLDFGLTNRDADLVRLSVDTPIPTPLTRNEIQDLFGAGVVTYPKAIDLLRQTGLSVSEAQLLVSAWESIVNLDRPKPTVSQYIGAYRDGFLSRGELSTKLFELGYFPDSVAFYLNIADLPAVEATRELTKSDILSAYQKELLSYRDAQERLINMGFAIEDSELLLELKRESIERSQAHTLFMAGFILPEEYIEVLYKLGYTTEEIDEYLTNMGY